MAAILKFRRGQGVPTLVISEPFWNELDTTLNIGTGINDGYVTLVNLNTTNNGNIIFSGDVTSHNANFSGDVFIGGTLTMGNGNDEIIVGAPFSGSLIPSDDSVFNIGNSTTRWLGGYFDNIYATNIYGDNIIATEVPWSGVTNKPTVVSGSEQIDHNLTQNYVPSKHVDHSLVFINAGNGLEGGGDILSTRTISLDSGSTYFTEGVTHILDNLGVISGSNGYSDTDTLDFINSIQVLSGSLDNRTIDGLTLTNVIASGSFSGSYIGDGSQLTGVVTGSGTFDPNIDDSVIMSETHGGIVVGTSVGDLRGHTYDQLFGDILFPTVISYVQTSKSVSIGNIPTSTQEVGTNLKPTLNVTFNPGDINNGDNTNGPDLVGTAQTYSYRLPNSTLDGQHTTVNSNTDSFTFTGDHNLIFGTNRWRVEVIHDIGTGTYHNNKGVDETHLDGLRTGGTVIRNTNTIYGRYYSWYGFGNKDSHPTDSSEVRGLTHKVFLNGGNNGSYNIVIPALTPEVYFSIPHGKSILVNYVNSSNADVTGTFKKLEFDVDNAGGVGTSYDTHYSFLGTTGYPSIATYKVTIS